MHLLDLPNESLNLILARIERADIVNVALSCRHLCRLSRWRILQLRYSNLEIGDEFCEDRTVVSNTRRTPLETLSDVVSNPCIIPHVSSLRFFGHAYKYCKTESSGSHAISRAILKALSQSKYINDDELETYLGAILTDACQDAPFAFLLTLLPNLKELIIDTIPGPWTKMMVCKIVERTHNSKGPHALGKLKNLTLWDNLSKFYGLPFVTSFAQLPSLRVIFGGLWMGSGESNEELWSSSPHTSGVESIRAFETRIEPNCCSPFFAGFRNLREFSLNVARTGPWEAKPFRDALLEYAADTLESLDICGNLDDLPETFIGSLRGFKVLKHMSLCYAQFVNGRTTQRLVDILPASAETLMLRDLDHYFVYEDEEDEEDEDNAQPQPELTRLFAELVELKGERLPNLWKIECCTTVDQSIMTTCQAAGIRIYYNENMQSYDATDDPVPSPYENPSS